MVADRETPPARLMAIIALALLAACQSREPTTPATAGAPAEWARTLRMVRRAFPDVPQISTSELATWLADPGRTRPLLLDARSAAEYDVSHLADARLAENPLQARTVLAGEPLDRPIVVYCSVGYRSSALARVLREAGHAEVSNLEGSIFAWANEDRPVFAGTQRAKRVHPYDRTWGKLLRRDLWSEP